MSYFEFDQVEHIKRHIWFYSNGLVGTVCQISGRLKLLMMASRFGFCHIHVTLVLLTCLFKFFIHFKLEFTALIDRSIYLSQVNYDYDYYGTVCQISRILKLIRSRKITCFRLHCLLKQCRQKIFFTIFGIPSRW